MKQFFTIFTCILLTHLCNVLPESDDHKLVFIISIPRSLSTVFLYMNEVQNTCAVLSEPGITPYTLKHTPEFADDMIDDASPTTYEQAEKEILQLHKKHKLVFVKEVSYVAQEYVFKNTLGKRVLQEAHVIFLIRHPHNAYVSFYKKFPKIFDLLPEWLSYKTIYDMYQNLSQHAHIKPHIIMVDNLLAHPEHTIKKIYSSIGIPFDPKKLIWQPLIETMSTDHPWNNESCKFWYDRVLTSHSLGRQTQYACDAHGKPTFTEISDTTDRAQYKHMYEKNLPYYYLLAQAALSNT